MLISLLMFLALPLSPRHPLLRVQSVCLNTRDPCEPCGDVLWCLWSFIYRNGLVLRISIFFYPPTHLVFLNSSCVAPASLGLTYSDIRCGLLLTGPFLTPQHRRETHYLLGSPPGPAGESLQVLYAGEGWLGWHHVSPNTSRMKNSHLPHPR